LEKITTKKAHDHSINCAHLPRQRDAVEGMKEKSLNHAQGVLQISFQLR
jgi:hypothetical protein